MMFKYLNSKDKERKSNFSNKIGGKIRVGSDFFIATFEA